MKKYRNLLSLFLVTVCCIITGCSKEENNVSTQQNSELSQFMYGDVLVTIKSGAPLITKCLDLEYYTVTGILNTTEYSMYVEAKKEDDGFEKYNVFTQDGEWLFSEIYLDGEYISSEYAELDDEFELIETKGSRRPDETYSGCVRRVKAKLKETGENNNPILSEFVPVGAIAAVVGIIDCAQYGNQF